jgi:futalosine hydrolase
MKILVVAATEFEIEPFICEKNNVDILITGVGIPATVFHLTKKLLENKYDLAIQAGIAGTFNNQIKKANVVMVSEDAFADIGIDEKQNFTTLFENDFINENDFPYKNGWLKNTSPFLLNNAFPKVKGVTINTITDNEKRIKTIIDKFNPAIESMEGAAFHYVCLQQKINFIQIRGISNEVGERDKTKWKMKNAIANLNMELKNLIQKFS